MEFFVGESVVNGVVFVFICVIVDILDVNMVVVMLFVIIESGIVFDKE